MRRPVVMMSLALTFGIVIAYLIELNIAFFIAIGVGIFFIARLGAEKKDKESGIYVYAAVFLCFVLLGAGLLQFEKNKSQNDPLRKYAESSTQIEGIIIGTVEKEDCSKLEIAGKRGGKVLLSVYNRGTDKKSFGESNSKKSNFKKANTVKFQEGMAIRADAKISEPAVARNPSGFNYNLYLKTKKINYIASANENQVAVLGIPSVSNTYKIKGQLSKITGLSATYQNKIWNIRNDFISRISMYMSKENCGMMTAMLFGDKSGLDEDTYESFQKNGTAHILAVSGLHVGMVYGLFCALIGGKRKISTGVIVFVLLFFYAAMASFTPSVVRAVIMILLHIISKIFHYRYDLMSAGAATAGLMLLFNPYDLFGLGFQLSFLAIFSMAALLPLFKNMGENTMKKRIFKSVLLPVTVIQIGMAVYSAYTFNYFSLGAFLANIPVIFMAGIVVPIGVIALGITAVIPQLSEVFAIFVNLGIRGIIVCNNLFYANGIASRETVSPRLFLALMYYGFLFFFAADMTRIWIVRKNWGKVTKGIVVVVAIVLFLNYGFGNEFHKAQLIFVDVGQGDCLHIKTPKGKNIIVDGGGSEKYDVGKNTLKPYLLKNNVKEVDLALVSHLDTDHYKGISSLAREGMVEKLGLYEGNRLIAGKIQRETSMNEKDFIYMHSGQKFNIEEGIAIEILTPEAKSDREYSDEINQDEENPRSLVIKITYGKESILMTGDIDKEIESGLVSAYQDTGKLKADILKVAHHGSRYSSDDSFLEAVDPSIAVIQVGKNNYGHPTQEVIDKFKERNTAVFRNDTMGAIGFYGFNESKGVKVIKIIDNN